MNKVLLYRLGIAASFAGGTICAFMLPAPWLSGLGLGFLYGIGNLLLKYYKNEG